VDYQSLEEVNDLGNLQLLEGHLEWIKSDVEFVDRLGEVVEWVNTESELTADANDFILAALPNELGHAILNDSMGFKFEELDVVVVPVNVEVTNVHGLEHYGIAVLLA